MSDAFRSNRKATDQDLITLNSVGLSLGTIAKLLGCHPTTVTQRLKALKIEPADTRRTFMEDIFRSLNQDQQEWVASQVSGTKSIKEYVRELIIKDHQENKP